MEEIDFEQLYELGILSDDVYSWVISSKREIATLQAEINSALYELKQIDEIECSLGVWDAVSNAISLLENE